MGCGWEQNKGRGGSRAARGKLSQGIAAGDHSCWWRAGLDQSLPARAPAQVEDQDALSLLHRVPCAARGESEGTGTPGEGTGTPGGDTAPRLPAAAGPGGRGGAAPRPPPARGAAGPALSPALSLL